MATKKREPRNHYEALGVDRGSSEDEVKAAWTKLSRELHPDRHLGHEAQFTPLFARVSQAYAIVGSKRTRAQYDRELDVATKPCEKCKGEGRLWKPKGFGRTFEGSCGTCGGSGRTERRTR